MTEQRIAAEAVDRTAYGSGHNAFLSGSVSDFATREQPRFGQRIVTASVRTGGVYYDVEAVFHAEDDTLESYTCDCPAFYARGGACAHVCAVLFACLDRQKPADPTPAQPPLQTDLAVSAMLRRYQQAADREEEEEAQSGSVELLPTLVLPAADAPAAGGSAPPLPSLALSLSCGRVCVVKDIARFCADVLESKTVSFGRGASVTLSPGVFSPGSRALFELVQAKQAERAALTAYSLYDRDKKHLRLTPNALDRLYELYAGRALHVQAAGTAEKTLCVDGDPDVTLQVVRLADRAAYQFTCAPPVRCLSGERRLYVLSDGRLWRCGEAFGDRMHALLQALDRGGSQMTIADRDLPLFCSMVLPAIQDAVTLTGEAEALRAYRPEPFTLELYLDLPSPDVVSAEPQCVYGDRRINLLAAPGDDEVRRDLVREQQLLRRLERYFTDRRAADATRLFARGDEAIYRLLQEGVPALLPDADLFVTSRLRELKVQPPKISVGVRFSGNLLDLRLNTGGFSPAELAEALAAYRRGQKYFRLRDGQFLALENETMQELDELAGGLGVSDAALAAGEFAVPKFRALFLEGQMHADNALRFNRDETFTRLVQQFGEASTVPSAPPASLRTVLRGYQVTGFQWLKTMGRYGFGGILADDMGLGKTVQMIAALLDYVENTPEEQRRPSLVVSPTSLVLNWQSELARFAPSLRVQTVIGKAAERGARVEEIRNCDVALTSYDLLRRDASAYAQLTFQFLVLDEAQYIKNFHTLGAQAVRSIDSLQRFALTGTPIENRLAELWSIFDFLMPGYLYGYAVFKNRFELPAMRDGDRDAMQRLHRLVSPFILRRLKRDVLAELPPKTETVLRVPLEGEQRKLYVASSLTARDTLAAALGQKEGAPNRMQILALLTRLRQLCCDPALCCEGYQGESAKLDSCLNLLHSAIDSGHKLLLFSQFTSMLAIIERKLRQEGVPYYLLRGSTPKEKRADMVERFNHDDTPVFLMSLKAGGTGLNLTGADVVIHYDPWWNLAAQNQATDRVHRIGQRSRVQVYKLIAQDTIEERILLLQEKKRDLADAIVRDGDAALLSLSQQELLSLIL